MRELEDYLKPYSKAMVKLLKGPVESSASVWSELLHYQVEIQEYLGQIGLELIVKREEGFAFVTQFEDSEGNTQGLITRRQIGFETSIVLVVLRQSLEEYDSNPTQFQASAKFITDTEIKEELELFLPEQFNRVKFLQELDRYVKRIVDLGYLKEVNKKDQETTYQIRRIIKEKVSLGALQEFKDKLQDYVESI